MARYVAAVLVLAGAMIMAACSDMSSGTDRPSNAEAAQAPAITSAEDWLAVEAAVDAWLSGPTSATALDLATVVGERGDVDHGPYLVDLVRMTGSSAVRQAAISGLRDLRDRTRAGDDANGAGEGVELDVNGAYVELGSWVLDQRPDPGSTYPAFKSALYGAIDPGFVPMLETVEDRMTLAGIQWGGVPPGGIVELNQPVRIDPTDAGWAVDDEIVYAVDVAGDTIGYPRRIIGRHELANDEVVDRVTGQRVPFGVSYCSLCRTAVAFDRRVSGRELSFITSGLLLDANKVMVDNETGTLWQQASGLAIAGPLAGHRLDLLPLRVGSFADLPPGAQVLDLPEPFLTDRETGTLVTYPYLDVEPLPDYLAAGRLWFPVAGVDGEPDPLTEVATVVVEGGGALAVALDALETGNSAEISVGSVTVVVVQGTTGPRLFSKGEDHDIRMELEAGREAWFSWLARHPQTVRWPEE